MYQSKLMIAIIFLAIIVIALPSCEEEIIANERIEQIKQSNWLDQVGEEYTIEAHLVLEPFPSLLVDLEDRNINQIIPENRYIRLDISDEALTEMGEEYHGARVRLTGTVARDQDPVSLQLAQVLGPEYQAVLDVSIIPDILTPSNITFEPFNDICQANPAICEVLSIFNPETYIMLYSGGIDANGAYGRYWNDMVFFYFTMTWIYGVPADNIRVVYKNGVAENGFMPVHYPAYPNDIQEAFDWFEEEMDFDDTFIFFATNHGGHGFTDNNNDEADNDDECIYYYNQNSVYTDDMLADQINDLTFGRMLGIIEPCFGGGLLRDLSGPNRVLVSASTEDQVSYGGLQNYGNSYDDFVFHFTSALAGQHPDGNAVDADNNNDNKVSMAEAFEYARIADQAPETPQIESDGDGSPSNSFPAESNNYAATFFIE
ncbi:MAG: hypothetical protein AAF502_10225 [Bacteroidota bacterium]